MLSTGLRDLQKKLLREISTQMPRYGFGSRAVGQSFRRAEPFGVSSFHLSFIPHMTDFDVTADVALRIEAVEELLNQNNNRLSAKEKKQTFTVGAELGNIADGNQRRWTVSNVHHVPLVASGITQTFEATGLPYLQRMSNLENLLYVLSTHDRDAWLSSPIHERRCKTIIALAQTLKKTASMPALSAQCNSYLRDRNDPGLDSFREFAQRLGVPL
jgi:hypothetical protein